MAIPHLTKDGEGGQPQGLIDAFSALVYLEKMPLRSVLKTSGLLLFVGFLVSCSPGVPQLMPRETLFHLQLGTLEDQMDLFLRNGLPTPEENHFLYYNGLFLISNGNSRKVMEFTGYGDLVTLFYNPADNPQPELLNGRSSSDQVRDRRAFPYPFRHVGVLAADSHDRLYVEDRVPEGRIGFDPNLKVRLESVLLRFGKNGQFEDYLGQEGVGGTPFPSIDKVTVLRSDEVAVVCRLGTGWETWWFSPEGRLLVRAFLPFGSLPKLASETSGVYSDIQTIWPDRSRRLLWLDVDYFRKVQDPTTKTDSGIVLVQSRVIAYDPMVSKFSDGFALPVVPRDRGKASKENVTGDRPLDFLGITNSGLLFFLSSPENGGQRLLVFDQSGKLILERTIAYSAKENTWLSDFQVTPQGLLVAMTCDGRRVTLSWWRSDKFLSSYAPVSF